MARLSVLSFVIMLVITAHAATAMAEKRVALVIGNSDYQHVPALTNPKNDAEEIAGTFRSLGFSVRHEQNLTKAQLFAVLAEFSDQAAGADLAAIFYAGHGLEIGGINYLVPVDGKLKTDRRLRFEAFSLDDLLGALEGVRGVRIVLLDACRDNPFRASMTVSNKQRSVGRGLARVEAPSGTLVSFAAKEGQLAADGTGRHSPFTQALLNNLTKPGLELGLLFRKVRDSVMASTGGEQEPFLSHSLPSDPTYLVPPKSLPATGTAPARPNLAALTLQTNRRIELALWDAIKSSGSAELLKDYVRRYPLGEFVMVARDRLKRLASLGEPAGENAQSAKSPTGRELTRSLQSALAKAGCNPGPADGVWGRRGRRALRAFSRATGRQLPVRRPTGEALQAVTNVEGRVCSPAAKTQPDPVAGAPLKRRAKKSTRRTARKKAVRTRKSRSGKTRAKRKTTRKARQGRRKVARTSGGSSKRAGCQRVVRKVCAGLFGSGRGSGRCLAQGMARCRRAY